MSNEIPGGKGGHQGKNINKGPKLPDYRPDIVEIKDAKKKGDAEVMANTQEELEMEKLFHELEVAAKKLQEELSFNRDVNYENQKNRQEIKIEKIKNGFIVNSYGQKTEIIAKHIGEKDKIISLSIRGKAGEVVALGNTWNAKIDNKIISYKQYGEHDLIVLLGIANIINAGLFYAKSTENKSEEPFDFGSSHKRFGNYISYQSSKSGTLSFRTDFLSERAIEHLFLKHIEGEYVKQIFGIKNGLLKRLTQYLNLRFMDEVVNKQVNKDK